MPIPEIIGFSDVLRNRVCCYPWSLPWAESLGFIDVGLSTFCNLREGLYKKISNLKNAKEVESVKGVKLSAQGSLFQ